MQVLRVDRILEDLYGGGWWFDNVVKTIIMITVSD